MTLDEISDALDNAYAYAENAYSYADDAASTMEGARAEIDNAMAAVDDARTRLQILEEGTGLPPQLVSHLERIKQAIVDALAANPG